MGKGVPFEGFNVVYHAPPGQEDSCNSAHVFRNGIELVTCWELTNEELADVIRTKRVWFLIQSGGKLYPHYIGSERTVHALMVDSGPVWKLSESATPPADAMRCTQCGWIVDTKSKPEFNCFPFTENDCPGHVAKHDDPKVCGKCGVHIDSLRPPEQHPDEQYPPTRMRPDGSRF